VALGEAIVKGFPVPIEVPEPQASAYHFRVVPDPPVAVRTIFPASSVQRLLRSTVTDVGATGCCMIFTTTLAQVEGVQGSDSHRAKYVVVVVGEGIVKGLPEPIEVPDPQASVYHFKIVPEPPEAVKTIFPASSVQRLLRSVMTVMGATGC